MRQAAVEMGAHLILFGKWKKTVNFLPLSWAAMDKGFQRHCSW